MSAFAFDDFVESAWAEFRDDLATRLSTLADDGVRFTVDQGDEIPEGSHGTIEFTRTDDGDIRATISESDLRPTPDYADEHIRLLRSMGWHRSADVTASTLIFEVAPSDVGSLAQTAVQALREVWEVVHPAYIDDRPAPTESIVETAVLALGHEQLLELVVRALEEMRNEPVELDADADYPLPTPIPSWLRVLRDSPSVRFFALITDEIANPARAADYVARNAAKWPYVSLILDDSGVHAMLTQHLWMFHPKNLAAALATWVDFLRKDAPRIAEDLAELDDEPLPEAIMAMMQLEADGAELTPAEVAQVCRHDSSAILAYLRVCEEQYLAWEASAEDAESTGSSDEAEACRSEEESWRRTARQLRQALRLILLPES